MDKYENGAIELCQNDGCRGVGSSCHRKEAAFGRQCARDAYLDALRSVCWVNASHEALTLHEKELRAKAAALEPKVAP